MSTMGDVKDYLSGKRIKGTVQLSSKVSALLLDRLKREKKRASALKKDSTASTAQIECKSLIANILNLLSPIRRLPPEVLSEIFAHYIRDRKAWPEFRHRSTVVRKKQRFYDDLPPALFLSQVCISWRETIFAMPSLWSELSFSIHKGFPPTQAVAAWLSRSGTLPLNIIIRDFRRRRYGSYSFLADNLIPFCSRWYTLELSISFSYLTPLLRAGPLSLPLLERVDLFPGCLSSHDRLPALETAPRLKYFNVTSVAHSGIQLDIALPCAGITHLALEGIPQGPPEVYPFIQDLTSLQSLTLQLSDPPRDWKSTQTFEFPNLRLLDIEFIGRLGSPQFLDALNLPALKELSMKHHYNLGEMRARFNPEDEEFLSYGMYPFERLFARTNPSSSLVNLYERSGFELKSLVLDGITSLKAPGLLKFLKVTPTLESLTLDRCYLDVEILCEAMEVQEHNTDSVLLVPNMTKLRFVQDCQFEEAMKDLAGMVEESFIVDHDRYTYTISRMIESRWDPAAFHRFYCGCEQGNPEEWFDSWPVKRLIGGLEVSRDVLNPEKRDAKYLPKLCGEDEVEKLKKFEEQGMPLVLL